MNLVVWGLGKHATNKILPAVEKSNQFNLYGVCSRTQSTVDEARSAYKIKGWTSSEEMLKDKKIDAVYLSTPPALHKEQADSVLNKDKHILCEKPITMSYNDTSLLVKKAKAKRLILMEGLMYLHHPHHKNLRNIIYSEKLGKLNQIKISFKLPPLENPGYRKDKILGASAIYDLGIYPFSFVFNLYHKSEIELINKKIIYDKDLNYDVSGSAFLRIKKNIDCVIEWAYDETYSNELSISGEYLKLYSKFIFSKDIQHKAEISLYEQERLIENIEVDQADHFELMLKSFSESIGDTHKDSLETKSMLDLSSFLNKLIS